MRKPRVAATAFLLVTSGCGSSDDTRRDAGFYPSLAAHHSPVYIQGAATEGDFLTKFDFDGDWIGNNNWENMPHFPLQAYVYYSVKETRTHFFVHYAFFHPRDYLEDCDNPPVYEDCHENDLEGMLLVVEKDDSSFGRLLSMETQAHLFLFLYADDPAVKETAKKGSILFDGKPIEKEGSHPVAYVEVYGHGVYGSLDDLIELFPETRIAYRPAGRAEIQDSISDQDVSYQLLDIYSTLWSHREEWGNGAAFDRVFPYGPALLPADLDGDTYSDDGANAPWGWHFRIHDTGKLERGDWFLDPATATMVHQGFTEGEGYSLDYIFNPYLADLGVKE